MIRTQIYLPDDMYKELKLLAIKKNTNFSKLIRLGIKKVLVAEEKTSTTRSGFDNFIGKAKTNIKTHSTRDIHNHYENIV